MDENKSESAKENNIENKPENTGDNGQKAIAGAIVLAGILIAGAVLLKGSPTGMGQNFPANNTGIPVTTATLAPVGAADRTMGSSNAKVTLVMYEDFQCPYCGAVFGSQSNTALLQSLKQQDPSWTAFEPGIMNDYVKSGEVQFVYRDFAFLGTESVQSAQAARCAGDQGQFWQYHDYLFNHQNGEDQGAFSDPNLKSFAKNLGLNPATFNQCLDSGKYAQAVADSKTQGAAAGVTGTPKGFILRDGKIVSTIDGAEPYTSVKLKIDAALK